MEMQFKVQQILAQGRRGAQRFWLRVGAYQGLLALGASLGILLFVSIAVVWPLREQHKLRQQEMHLKQQQLELWQSFAKKNADYEGILAQAQQKQVRLREKLPEHFAVAENITRLQKMAVQSQVQLVVRQQAQAKGGVVPKMQSKALELQVSGTYGECLEFLRSLEKGALTGLEGFRIEARKQGLLTLQGQYRQYILP